MANNGTFEFYPTFKEFLPTYHDVTRVWIGDGVSTGEDGMLYAQYADGNVAALGSVSLYATAVEQGYTGTSKQWVDMIIGVADLVKGSTVDISYKVSDDGSVHPNPSGEWSPIPVFEKGKFTWAKLDLEWIDGNTTSLYFSTYQGQDGENGQVQSVNGEIGDVVLHGENLQISAEDTQTIKEYIDNSNLPETATDEEIDALFSMTFFSGAAFITGRTFNSTDSITYKIEAITPNAPMPQSSTVVVNPTSGSSCSIKFGNILYKPTDIPSGETTKTYQYKVFETANTMEGVLPSTIVHVVSVTLTDMGDGTIAITKSENFNQMFFVYKYTADGYITFEGSICLNGRTMTAREFMVQVKEGNDVIFDNLSTTTSAATGQTAAIYFPPINYTLDDVGTHVYKVKQTSTSGEGVTVSSQEYTVTVTVTDTSPDGHLEVNAEGDKNIDFVNTYEAFGSVTFIGTDNLVNRKYRNGDTLRVSVTGNGKLPSPAYTDVALVAGEDSANFEFATIQFTLDDMRNAIGGYDDTKVFNYTVTETSSITGITPDGLIHNISLNVVDNKKGSLVITSTYSDGNKVNFVNTYDAIGTIIFSGEKRLQNRKFVASDRMTATITSTNGGKLPAMNTLTVDLLVGQNVAPFNYLEMAYVLSDLNGAASRTFSYIISETTVITGATNDSLTHNVDVVVSDNYDGTLSVVPTYSDGAKAIFESIYDATGYIGLVGAKNIINRAFKDGDIMSVAITSTNGGKLPNPASITVPLTIGATNASFSFAQITYKIADLGGLSTKTFNYTITETTNMDGTTPVSISDTVSVTVTDMSDGTLNAVPTYTSGNKAILTNVYSASADLDFSARCIFTNGNMATNPFTVRITQVTSNNSTTQATENVVLAAPVTMTANLGNTQDLLFDNIVHFVKNSSKDDTQNSYWFMLEEVLPAVDAQGIYNNVKYDTNKKWINVSVADNYDGILTITKTPNASVDMIFTNEQLADLAITETWTGDDNRLTSAEKNVFTFIVAGPNSYSETFTYADMVNNQKVFEHLSLGEYTVTQTNNTVENFNIATTYQVGGNNTNRIVLAVGGGTINVTNNVNKLEGTVNIFKSWAGDHNLLTTAQKNSVTFTVTGPKQKSTDAEAFSSVFTYADMTDGRMTFSQMTLGTYTVTESNYSFYGLDVDVAYTVDGANSNSVTIGDADNKTITVTDTYTQQVGTVKLIKQFAGIEANQKPVNFSVSNNYNATVFTYANADNAATTDGVAIPYEWSITNVPIDTTIQFAESNAAITNYTLTATAVPANYTCAAVTKNNTSTVEITNSYVLDTGEIWVSKTFSGITAAQKPVNLTLTNNYNSDVFTYANAINADTADGITVPYRWIMTGIPVGTIVTFTEHNNEIEDYDLNAHSIPSNYTPLAVIKDSNVNLATFDEYSVHTGVARVTKQFVGITAAEKPVNFSITNDYNGTIFTYANAYNAATSDGITTPYEWVISNVPVHTVIEFAEQNASIPNYNITTTANPADYTTTISHNLISTVAIENSYEIQKGSVKVSKLFSGITSAEEPVNFNITNDYNNAVFTYANADNAGEVDGITDPFEWTITNVPVNTEIEFTENDYAITGYDLVAGTETIITSDPVIYNTTTTVDFVNEYEEESEGE